jgi:hypothetical protein
MRPGAVPAWICGIAVAGWGCGTAYAFWAFAPEPGRPFLTAAQAATFDPVARAAAAEAWFRTQPDLPRGIATVVAVLARDCDCNAPAAEHVARIERAYAARGVFVRRVAAEGAPVEAAPAALVFDTAGRLAYYGPYSDSAYCGAGGAGFVERALDAVLAGDALPLRPITATGCHCPVVVPTPSSSISSRPR